MLPSRRLSPLARLWSSSFSPLSSSVLSSSVLPALQELHPTLVEWRHDFHRHPELCFEEHRTSKLVEERLSSWDIAVTRGVGCETSIVGSLRGTAPAATTAITSIGLRADMDALPMQEENDVSHKSTIPGKMHGCGHDGHTTMLLGAAKYLSEHRDTFSGTVNFVFQPAEEDGGGGEKMVNEGELFKKFPCDEIYGMHNWPLNLPPGQISVRSGPIMACADDFEIVLRGAGGHAAMPHLTIDPIVMGSALILQLQTLVSRTVDPLDPAVVSITGFEGGNGARNVIPDAVTLVGTVRAFKEETRLVLKQKLKDMCEATAKTYGGQYKLEYNDGYPATSNTPQQTEYAAQVATEMVGSDNVVRDLEITMGAEDFSYMLQKVPGCYIWLGSSSEYFLHHPKYDFDDDTLSLGASWFVKMVENRLGHGQQLSSSE